MFTWLKRLFVIEKPKQHLVPFHEDPEDALYSHSHAHIERIRKEAGLPPHITVKPYRSNSPIIPINQTSISDDDVTGMAAEDVLTASAATTEFQGFQGGDSGGAGATLDWSQPDPTPDPTPDSSSDSDSSSYDSSSSNT